MGYVSPTHYAQPQGQGTDFEQPVLIETKILDTEDLIILMEDLYNSIDSRTEEHWVCLGTSHGRITGRVHPYSFVKIYHLSDGEKES